MLARSQCYRRQIEGTKCFVAMFRLFHIKSFGKSIMISNNSNFNLTLNYLVALPPIAPLPLFIRPFSLVNSEFLASKVKFEQTFYLNFFNDCI